MVNNSWMQKVYDPGVESPFKGRRKLDLDVMDRHSMHKKNSDSMFSLSNLPLTAKK